MEKQQSLVHVDLSWNRFNKEDSLLIAEAIKPNHSMIGFHFDGNTGQIDERQFLVIKDEEKKKVMEIQPMMLTYGQSHLNQSINSKL